MKKLVVRLAIVAFVLLILVVVGITMSLGRIIKKGVETVGPQITKTEMKLDSAVISVFSGSGTLKGFLLGNPEGYKTPSAVQVGEVSLGVRPGSVLGDKIHVTHVRIHSPEITFEGTMGKKNNLSTILENVEGTAKSTDTNAPPSDPGSGPSRKLQVDDFLISGAKVNASLNFLGGKSVNVTIPDIHFTNLGAGPDGITAAELTKRVLQEVTAATLKAVEKMAADASKGATELLNSGTSNAVDKASKSLGDLLKKK